MDQVLVIDAYGRVLALYNDNLPDFGVPEITRASSVEPDPENGGWMVTLSDDPKNGKFAGKTICRGVPRRADALAYEVRFIQENILCQKTNK